MDPLTLAGTFATIVGLLSNFKAERSGASLDAFVEWLRESQNAGLAETIAQNKALADELSKLLSVNHQDLVSRLSTLQDQIASIASSIEGFGGLVNVLAAAPKLSSQARSILSQLVESRAQYAMEHKLSTGRPPEIQFIGAPAAGQIQYDEPRFVNEDLDSLVAAGLLRVEFASKGSRKFFATREAIEFVRNNG
ncbi:hypothetical protein [Variovorax paradoxus]|uniref:hypothetical protein n=1 Tax=Variovorax paradoxus TaxID=34073 RepID=UPI0019322372|nr:hypothetical protein INQ48_35630 [Variovorax paradoxus]